MMRLGSTEIILIIVLALILFGGSRISGLGKALGKSIKEFRSEIKPDGVETVQDATDKEGSLKQAAQIRLSPISLPVKQILQNTNHDKNCYGKNCHGKNCRSKLFLGT